eukprot:TRINITY_DN570_c0_g1_i1.p3 TRINITY_DN570_c0_g1~~TRINITY_DN570_c0_g1_i1.p3  ORF type:complete len:59 (+),score=4.73 TRINITY_DN570_c0_g1_i1:195-371(+)
MFKSREYVRPKATSLPLLGKPPLSCVVGFTVSLFCNFVVNCRQISSRLSTLPKPIIPP